MANEKIAPLIYSNNATYKFWKSCKFWKILKEVVCGTPKNEQEVIVIIIFDW